MIPKSLVEYKRQGVKPQEFLTILKNELGEKKYTDLKSQEIFYKTIICDKTILKFPIAQEYKMSVVKRYVDAIMNHNEEVSEDLLNLVITKKNNTAEYYHIIYQIDKIQTEIISRVRSKFENVGLWLWESGKYLAEIIYSFPEYFNNKTMLELGAGVGCTAKFIEKFCKGTKLILSDYNEVVDNCKENLKVNDIDMKRIEVIEMDWEKDYEDSFYNKNIDILLSADSVYDPVIIPPLVKTTKKLFENNKIEFAMFVVSKRTEKTFNYFIEKMKENQFCIEEKVFTTGKNEFFEMQKYIRDYLKCFIVKKLN